MGTSGAGLYEDDTAADLKAAIALVNKVPISGERLLEILLDSHDIPKPREDDGTVFWLVVADQFERRGIACAEAAATALSVISDGTDLERLRAHGLGDRELAQREEILQQLAQRLRAPRPVRPRVQPKNPPDFVVDVGEVYAFPTMRGKAANAWFETWEQSRFVPDAWGALLILERGRAYDWLPWCTVASLTTAPERVPSLADALSAKLLLHSQTNGAAKCVPKRVHVKRMKMQLLGRVQVNSNKASRVVSHWTVEMAINCGWSIASAAFSTNVGPLPVGVAVSDLIDSGG
ncbi:MAG TPA: hypothetical protein VNZ27_10555 [Rhodanobacter sp.]|jgi:hypothetical protein|nr:hypothetical protein [Rhodanobacter sp.]